MAELLTSLKAFIPEIRNGYPSIEKEAFPLTEGTDNLNEDSDEKSLQKKS